MAILQAGKSNFTKNRVTETIKLYPYTTRNSFNLVCFCPSSCGHMFSDSNSMLGLIQTILQSHSTMSFVPAISDYDMTQQFTHWSSY